METFPLFPGTAFFKHRKNNNNNKTKRIIIERHETEDFLINR